MNSGRQAYRQGRSTRGRWRRPGGAICLALVFGCADGGSDSSRAGSESTVYATNGARIYYTARSGSGELLLVSPEFGEPPVPATKSCADCHGADGQGALLATDSGYTQTPDITFARLASPLSYRRGRVYDEGTLALTIRSGVRIDGYLLSADMPRWHLSREDMADLIDHLKTLDAGTGLRPSP